MSRGPKVTKAVEPAAAAAVTPAVVVAAEPAPAVERAVLRVDSGVKREVEVTVRKGRSVNFGGTTGMRFEGTRIKLPLDEAIRFHALGYVTKPDLAPPELPEGPATLTGNAAGAPEPGSGG